MFLSASSAGSALSVVLLALVFFAFHLPYLPFSLEDLDSINFALGVRQFDVARHQPHPPGYPVFIAAGKIVHLFVRDEAKALALIGVVGGALGVLAVARLFRRLDSDRRPDGWTLAAAALAITSPMYWFTAARPLSDMSGFAAALAVQAMTLGASNARALAMAAFCAGLATGIRSQVFWLTAPLLIARGLGAGGWGLAVGPAVPKRERLAASPQQLAPSPEPPALAATAAAFGAGALVWFVPLVAATGGPAAYWRALSNQGAEDLGNITMLWTTHSLRAVADALYYALVAPWAAWTVAIIVLLFCAAGSVWLWRANRRALALLAAAFGPYFVFDLLFQETFTSRYALPLVVPMAFLAAAGMRALPRGAGAAAAIAIALFDAHVGGTSIAAYSREKAPAFRLLDDMHAAVRGQPPVVAMDRRNSFDFRRPLVWQPDALPTSTRTLAAPPQHEWLEPVKYWNSGGRAPVWFVVDPKRTAIDLLEHGEPARYRWPLPYPVLVSGARPDEMDWYRVDRPEWYVGEGWSLTPEAAGVATADRRGLAFGEIHAGIARAAASDGGAIMIGGRSFDPAARPRLSVALDGRPILDRTLAAGPFLEFARVTPGDRDRSTGDYSALSISATPPASVAIEQFDASARRPLVGFGAGWQEQEFNPATGARWRWLSEHGELQLVPRGTSVTLHLEGESPRRYFSRGSRLVVRSRDRALFDRVLDDDFSIDVPIEVRAGAAPEPIVLETDQIYVPAERSRRTQDRRHLGLRIFKCELR